MDSCSSKSRFYLDFSDLPKNCDETTDSEASRCGKEARINPTSEYGMDSVNKFTCTENYSKVEQAFIEEIVETSVITTETLTYDQGPVDLLARPECEPSEPQLEYKPVDHLFSLAETSCDEYTDRNQASNTNTGTIHRRGPAVATEHTDPSLQHNLHEPTICILNLLRQCPSADNYITCGKLHRDQMYIWEIYIETKWQRFDSGNALESAYGDPQNEHLKFEKYVCNAMCFNSIHMLWVLNIILWEMKSWRSILFACKLGDKQINRSL